MCRPVGEFAVSVSAYPSGVDAGSSEAVVLEDQIRVRVDPDRGPAPSDAGVVFPWQGEWLPEAQLGHDGDLKVGEGSVIEGPLHATVIDDSADG